MIFKSGYRITQLYGVNYNYYKQFGLDGHEGLDLCPLDADWNIRSFDYRGICVKDIDNPRDGGAYGNYTTIWYPELNLAFQYCHMAKTIFLKMMF